MSHYTFARCVGLEASWGSTDWVYLLPRLAARGTKTHPTFWEPTFLCGERDNYKTGLVLSQRCVGLEDKADVVTGGREVTVELLWGLQWEVDTVAQYICVYT